jgi:hypothetical protein
MFIMAVAHSRVAEMKTCAALLVAQASAQLDGETPKAGLLFSTFGLDHAVLLAELARMLPDCPIVGGSSYGEVSRELGYQLGSSLLILFASDTVGIRAGVIRGLGGTGELAQAESIKQQLSCVRRSQEQPVLGLLFPDGLGLEGTPIVRNIANLLPKTHLFGGSTAENLQNKETLQFFDTEVLQHAVPYLFFYGPIRFSWAVTEGLSAGWSAISERLDATCDGRFIRTIDGQPVFGYLRGRYSLDGSDWSYVHPFAVYSDSASDHHVLCDVIRFDTATGLLECAQNLPSVCQIQLTQPDPAAIVRASRRALLQTLANDSGLSPAAGVLWFSCVNRALVLDVDAANEYRTATDEVMATLPIAGFQTYGEIAPGGPTGDPFYHSCSLVTLLLGEAPRPTGAAVNAAAAISAANLAAQNQMLAESLKSAQAELEQLRRALAESQAVARLVTHSRTEQRLRHLALALELLCEILDTRFNDIRRVALKGDPIRLNKSGLARLIDDQHRRRYSESFPLTLAQLARLLSPQTDSD